MSVMEKIIFDDVSLKFGDNIIFKNCNREIFSSKVIGIFGKNGSGKSTFLKLAGKIIKSDEGKVNFFDGKILSETESLGKVSLITPEMKIYDDLTVLENLEFFSKLRGKSLSDEEKFQIGERVGLDLKKFGLSFVGNLSTGMCQRLKFAILLMVDSEICLLDEPTANLDEEGKNIFHAEIKNLAQSEKIILIATNDEKELNICDEVITLPLD